MTLPVYDLSSDAGLSGFKLRIDRLRATVSGSSEAARTVGDILADVRARGDEAVVDCMRRWTDPQFASRDICATPQELAEAEAGLDPALRQAIEGAIAHVRAYQEHIKPRDPPPVVIGGAELGLRFTPVESVGLLVPGGAAVLFSTLVMLAAPALVAGVDPRKISVVNPPPTRKAGQAPRGVSPIVLAACRMLGIEKVYRIGGAQAVAALAYGTDRVAPVHMVAGPGNVYTQLAKQQVAGLVGVDGVYGPSEIVTIADESADPRLVAADLIAQAEHDPGKCFLIAWQRAVIDNVLSEVERQMAHLPRQAAINRALAEDSCAVLVDGPERAVSAADAIAAEHVNLAVKNPDALLARIRHGGEFFLGDQTPVAAGDYWAGPSHCLPTGTTARFASGISVYSFLKRSGVIRYRDGLPREAMDAIALMAQAEGLDGHARSARVRGEK